MNQLNAMRVFRCLAETAGFSAAAERLGTTHSSVSRQLQQLEAQLGVQLVQRTTRRFSLTAEGRQYQAACCDILDRIDAAASALHDARQTVSGPLRVSVPLSIGTLELEHWLPRWRQAYPEVQLQLGCGDRFVDLVAEGFDLALRITPALADTSLQARLLTRSALVLVAAPAYVQRRGLPRSVQALEGHELLAFSGTGEWCLADEHQRAVKVGTAGAFQSDTITVLHAAALAGLGIAAFTQATVQGDLREGRLVRILPGHTLGARHYYALYPQTRHLAPPVRAFIDFMAHHYSSAAQA